MSKPIYTNLDFNNTAKINNLPDPVNSQDPVTKAWALANLSGGGGGGSTIHSGQATIDFGTYPGTNDSKLVITGQSTILTTNIVMAWLYPTTTADHSADEHVMAPIKIVAGNIVAGTGFTIYAINLDNSIEPIEIKPNANTIQQTTATAIGMKTAQPGFRANLGGNASLQYGLWTVAWLWF